MKSDTPRTNALALFDPPDDWWKILLDHSRQLERELNHALALLRVYRNEIQTGKLERTRQQQILDALNNE